MSVEKSISQLLSTPQEAEVEVETTVEEQMPLFASDDTVMLDDGGAIVGYVEDDEDEDNVRARARARASSARL